MSHLDALSGLKMPLSRGGTHLDALAGHERPPAAPRALMLLLMLMLLFGRLTARSQRAVTPSESKWLNVSGEKQAEEFQ